MELLAPRFLRRVGVARVPSVAQVSQGEIEADLRSRIIQKPHRGADPAPRSVVPGGGEGEARVGRDLRGGQKARPHDGYHHDGERDSRTPHRSSHRASSPLAAKHYAEQGLDTFGQIPMTNERP